MSETATETMPERIASAVRMWTRPHGKDLASRIIWQMTENLMQRTEPFWDLMRQLSTVQTGCQCVGCWSCLDDVEIASDLDVVDEGEAVCGKSDGPMCDGCAKWVAA